MAQGTSSSPTPPRRLAQSNRARFTRAWRGPLGTSPSPHSRRDIMTVLTQHAPGTFCWPELLTTDQNAAKKFYTSQFGWKTNDIPLGPDAVYTIFQKNGKDLAALWKLSPDQTKKMGMPPNWNPYVAVTSADQSAAKAKQLGGTVLVEPMDVMDKGRMAAIKDPTGAAFSIWQAKSSIGASVLD